MHLILIGSNLLHTILIKINLLITRSQTPLKFKIFKKNNFLKFKIQKV